MEYQSLNDNELLILLKDDDSLAFKEIYQRYFKKVYLTGYQKVQNKEVAEEMAQNLFVSLWERRYALNIRNLQHYLLRSVKFIIINYYKSQIVEEKYINYVLGSCDEKEYSTEQLILTNDLTAAIEKGIAMLPQKTQKVFKLSRVEQFSTKEISKALDISEKAVEYHITQSLKLMKLHLKDYLAMISSLLLYNI